MNPRLAIILTAALCLTILTAAFIMRPARYQAMSISHGQYLRFDTTSGHVRLCTISEGILEYQELPEKESKP